MTGEPAHEEPAPLIVEALRAHAAARPEDVAVDFMEGRARPGGAFTYAALDAAALRIAGMLHARLAPGARVVIAEPPGVEFVAAFFGCLYAGMIAVPVAMPRRAGTDDARRFAHVLEDAGCTGLLAPASIIARLAAMPEIGETAAAMWIDPAQPHPPRERPVPAARDDVAFLQYTSGSTGSPKGVMVTHGNIAHNVRRIITRCRLGRSSRALIWLPHFHDLGLVGGILVPLYAGFPTTLLSPLSFVKRPLDWLRMIGDGGYTISGGPNFAFRLCVETAEDQDLAALDLSSWACAFNCAEPIDAETVHAFAERFAAHGFRAAAFYPCYGMAESTLSISSNHGPRPVALLEADAAALDTRGRAEPPRAGRRTRTLVGVGQACADQVLAIVDPATLQEVGDRHVGEIWTSDASVAAGYWRRPEQTREIFSATLASRPGRTFLRTGDLGVLDRGELFVTGRLKDLIIVDGRNIHPEDIEATVRTAGDIGATLAIVAFAATAEGAGEGIVVVTECERGRLAEARALERRIQDILGTQFELTARDVLIVPPGRIPRTTSGKVKRRETRRLHESGAFAAVNFERAKAEE